MSAPPRVAQWLLETALAGADRDAIVGDLSEEFCRYVVPAHGVLRARWWYRCQVARSLAPLVLRSWERASLFRASLAVTAAAVVAAAPAALLIMLRSFVLQQVPLKATGELSRAFAVLLALVVLVAGALGLAAAIRVLRAKSLER